MIYYTGLDNQMRQTAGAKAPSDIQELCRRRGYTFLPVPITSEKLPHFFQLVQKYLDARKYWQNTVNTLGAGDVLIYQHRLYVSRLLPNYIEKIKQKGIRLILVIHDLETLRKGIEGVVKADESLNTLLEGTIFRQFDAVICHNEKMKAYLLSLGYNEQQVVCLEIFDYLSDCKVDHPEKKNETPSIATAGNLASTKSGYLYRIYDGTHNAGLTLHLFGLNFEDTQNSKMVYHGSFPAAELPAALEGDFGLVWDGLSAETCTGHVGEYLRYNNPHKTSLYLSSGIPVIVWKEAAICDFVLREKVGIAVSSLYEAEDAIRAVSEEDYTQMCHNARQLSEKLRSGYYFYQALDICLDRITGSTDKIG